MNRTFRFILADGTAVTQGFNLVPVNYPITEGANVVNGDPLSFLSAPQTVDLVDNVLKVELNKKSSNDWFISTSGSVNTTASANIVSGSYYTGSMSKVLFNFIDHIRDPKELQTIEIKPANKNVGYEQSFVLEDSLTYTTNGVGSITVDLVPQTYNVTFNGTKKKTRFLILPSGNCTASAIIVSSLNVAKNITPLNQSEYGYTAVAADARFMTKGGSIDNAISSSYALTASYSLNGGGSGNNGTASVVYVASSNAPDDKYLTFIDNEDSYNTIQTNNQLFYNPTSMLFFAQNINGTTINAGTFKGPLQGTASEAGHCLDADVAEYANNAGNAATAGTATNLALTSYSITSSRAISSSYSLTASYALNGGGSGTSLNTGSTYPITSSWAITASYAMNGGGSGTTLSTGSTYPITSSWAKSASFWDSSSVITLIGTKQNTLTNTLYVLTSSLSQTASYWDSSSVVTLIGTKQNTLTNTLYVLTSSLSQTASFWNSSSLVSLIGTKQNTLATGSTYPFTSSWATNALTASTSDTFIVRNNASVNGTLFASDISFQTSADITLSPETVDNKVSVVGNLQVQGRINSPSITSSLQGTASWARSASWAPNTGGGVTSGGSYNISCSWASSSFVAQTAVSADYAVYASAIGNQTYTTVTTSSTRWITASFSSPEQWVNIPVAGLYSFTCSNIPVTGSVKDLTLYFNNTATETSSLSFPATWKNLNGGWATSVTASKIMVVTLRAYGPTIIGNTAIEN